MVADTILRKEWNISDTLKQQFSTKMLKTILHALNRMKGKSYFFIDHYYKELIVDSDQSLILCEYPKKLALTEGLTFFERILKKEELDWHKRLMRPMADVFFGLDENDRQNLTLLYDMPILLKSGKERVLHYKATPFHLCDNGNLWLQLCCASPSISQSGHNVCILNLEADTRYDFNGTIFVPSKVSLLTAAEREILQLLLKNMQETEICDALQISKYKYHRIKNLIYKKLEVSTSVGAVHRAHQLGLI